MLQVLRQEYVIMGSELEKRVADFGITHAVLPPAVLAALPERVSLDSIRVLFAVGEILKGSVKERWNRGRQLINSYGPTEASICTTVYECRAGGTGNPP